MQQIGFVHRFRLKNVPIAPNVKRQMSSALRFGSRYPGSSLDLGHSVVDVAMHKIFASLLLENINL